MFGVLKFTYVSWNKIFFFTRTILLWTWGSAQGQNHHLTFRYSHKLYIGVNQLKRKSCFSCGWKQLTHSSSLRGTDRCYGLPFSATESSSHRCLVSGSSSRSCLLLGIDMIWNQIRNRMTHNYKSHGGWTVTCHIHFVIATVVKQKSKAWNQLHWFLFQKMKIINKAWIWKHLYWMQLRPIECILQPPIYQLNGHEDSFKYHSKIVGISVWQSVVWLCIKQFCQFEVRKLLICPWIMVTFTCLLIYQYRT